MDHEGAERRYTRSAFPSITTQSRAADGGQGGAVVIVGYGAIFYDASNPDGTQYEIQPGFVERIDPHAFDRAIREDRVIGLFNHDDNNVLGCNQTGTMRLSVDRIGLRYEIDAPDTQIARDLVAILRRGDVCGSSFSFVPGRKSLTEDTDKFVTTQLDVAVLFDVGPVTYPAYKGATSGVRGGMTGNRAVVVPSVVMPSPSLSTAARHYRRLFYDVFASEFRKDLAAKMARQSAAKQFRQSPPLASKTDRANRDPEAIGRDLGKIRALVEFVDTPKHVRQSEPRVDPLTNEAGCELNRDDAWGM